MSQVYQQQTSSPKPSRPSSRTLWIGLMSGPVIWSIEFLVVYLLVEIACQAGLLQDRIFGMQWISLVVIIVTIVTLAAIIYFAYYAYRSFQQAGGSRIFERESLGGSPARFMALSGMALNLLFGLLILLMGIPAIVLSPCIR